jgi:hypothetical protein
MTRPILLTLALGSLLLLGGCVTHYGGYYGHAPRYHSPHHGYSYGYSYGHPHGYGHYRPYRYGYNYGHGHGRHRH